MRTVVFTALIGPGAPMTVDMPLIGLNSCGVVFTDRQGYVAPGGWVTKEIPPTKNHRHTARMIKHAPDELFPDADVTVWVDASFTWLKPADVLVDDAIMLGTPIVALRHPDRNRIRDEAYEVIRCRQAPARNVEQQIMGYRAQGFDTDVHPQPMLTTTGLLVRFSSMQMVEFNRALRTEICATTVRDQLSFDYVRWVMGMPVGYLLGHYRDNPYVKYHRNRKVMTIA